MQALEHEDLFPGGMEHHKGIPVGRGLKSAQTRRCGCQFSQGAALGLQAFQDGRGVTRVVGPGAASELRHGPVHEGLER